MFILFADPESSIGKYTEIFRNNLARSRYNINLLPTFELWEYFPELFRLENIESINLLKNYIMKFTQITTDNFLGELVDPKVVELTPPKIPEIADLTTSVCENDVNIDDLIIYRDEDEIVDGKPKIYCLSIQDALSGVNKLNYDKPLSLNFMAKLNGRADVSRADDESCDVCVVNKDHCSACDSRLRPGSILPTIKRRSDGDTDCKNYCSAECIELEDRFSELVKTQEELQTAVVAKKTEHLERELEVLMEYKKEADNALSYGGELFRQQHDRLAQLSIEREELLAKIEELSRRHSADEREAEALRLRAEELAGKLVVINNADESLRREMIEREHSHAEAMQSVQEKLASYVKQLEDLYHGRAAERLESEERLKKLHATIDLVKTEALNIGNVNLNLHQQVAQLKTEILRLTDELAIQRATKTDCSLVENKLIDTTNKYEAAIVELSRENDSRVSEISQLQEELRIREERIATAEERCRVEQGMIIVDQKQRVAEIAELQAKISQLQLDKEKCGTDIHEFEELLLIERNRALAACDNLRADNDKLNGDRIANLAKIRENEAKIAELAGYIQELELSRAGQTGQITEYDNLISQHQSEIEFKNKEIEELKLESSTKDQEISRQREMIDRLNARMSELSKIPVKTTIPGPPPPARPPYQIMAAQTISPSSPTRPPSLQTKPPNIQSGAGNLEPHPLLFDAQAQGGKDRLRPIDIKTITVSPKIAYGKKEDYFKNDLFKQFQKTVDDIPGAKEMILANYNITDIDKMARNMDQKSVSGKIITDMVEWNNSKIGLIKNLADKINNEKMFLFDNFKSLDEVDLEMLKNLDKKEIIDLINSLNPENFKRIYKDLQLNILIWLYNSKNTPKLNPDEINGFSHDKLTAIQGAIDKIKSGKIDEVANAIHKFSQQVKDIFIE